MKSKKVLMLLPIMGLFLTGCAGKIKDTLRPAKHWVGENLYWPLRNAVLGEDKQNDESNSAEPAKTNENTGPLENDENTGPLEEGENTGPLENE